MTGPTDIRPGDVEPIAVIGMAGRFPGAPDVGRFWTALCAGTDSIARFSPPGGETADFVGAEGVLDDIACFDAEFFGITPREAEITDPQHRLALETAWAAFDGAGYDPAAVAGTVGVYLGASMSSYLVRNLLPNPGLADLVGGFGLLVHNDKDAVATSVSHRLGLRGPSFAVGSACSSSLVAVHLAGQALQTAEVDLAVAGGVGLLVPPGQGHRYSEAGIYSPDGRCRAFDAAASGTVGGSGVGVVLLKRLSDARRDRDHVHAVILGSAVTNDGGVSQSFTAPGVDGQVAAITEAHAVAGVGPEEIGYVEGHGTATPLGDAVEITALTQAFRRGTDRTGFCALGSVKSNIGHLDAAAGVASLIKTVLAVREGTIPASLHVERPTAHVDLAATPFVVATTTRRWGGGEPRTAGVSAFGIGGTNAHVVVRQAPPVPDEPLPARRWQALPLSGRDPAALSEAATDLAAHLRATPGTALADVAMTVAGRRAQRVRHAVVATDRLGAARAMESLPSLRDVPPAGDRPVVMLLPGLCALQPGAVTALARDEPTFARHLAECAAVLADLGVDLDTVLDGPGATGPAVGLPVQFAVEYALAATLEEWGLRASVLIGHSLGEYVAATLAGVFSLPAALRLVQVRGHLCAELPGGAMLAVAAGRDTVAGVAADAGLCLAADNGPAQCVLSGGTEAIQAVADGLTARGVAVRTLPVGAAYHSPAVDPLVDRLRAAVRAAAPVPATRRIVTTVTGRWADPDEIADPDHWTRHLRCTVRFGDALDTVLSEGPAIVVDTGPSAVLGALTRQYPARSTGHTVLCCQPSDGEEGDPAAALVAAVAAAWEAGAPVQWDRFNAAQRARRTACPPSPLRRRRHWIDPPPAAEPAGRTDTAAFLRAHCADRARTRPIRTVGERPGLRADLHRLCVALGRRYLADAGVDLRPGARHRADDLAAQLRVLPEFRGLLDQVLGSLVTDGQLEREDGGLLRVADGGPADPAALAAAVAARHPGLAGLVELLVHCVVGYHDALTTPGAALGVLYPDGRGDLLAGTLGRTEEHLHTGHGVAAVAALVARRAGSVDRPLRVLEVGAGGGRLTWAMVEALGERPAELLVTDVNRMICELLATEAARRGARVRTALLDITGDASGQGVDGGFDLVVGLDAVHVAADVPAAVRMLGGLLAPQGELVLVETVACELWQSLIWGLSADWWRATDGLREGGGPLLAPRGWERALTACGLGAVDVVELPAGTPAGPDTVVVVGGPAARAHPPAAELPARRPDPKDWLYLPTWAQTAPLERGAVAGRCLVFTDGPTGDAVERAWSGRGGDAIVVRPGPAFAADGPGFTIDPAAPQDYRTLIAALVAAGRAPQLVVHTWSADGPSGPPTPDDVDDRLGRGLHSLLFLATAHGAVPGSQLRRVLAVTAGGQAVTGAELLHPEHSGVAAAVKIVPREFPDLACSVLDVPADRSAASEGTVDRIVDELVGPPTGPVAALRGGRRWTPAFVPDRRRPTGSGARPGGVYLVTGGLGGIGLALGEYLAGLPSTVVLTARTPFADPADWSRLAADPGEPRSATARRLLAAGGCGGAILTAAVDVTDRDAMRALVRDVEARFGAVTGVVHAAGVVDGAGMIARRSRSDTDAAIAAKVHGTLVLDEVLGDRELDFFVLCSSLGPILHRLKFGEVGYVAGNEFLDAYAAFRAGRGRRATVSIAWTDWVEAGMWARARPGLARFDVVEPGPLAFSPAADLLQGITEADGVTVFRDVVGRADTERIVVSTQDLDALLAHHDAFSTTAHRELVDRLRRVDADADRPAAAGPYVAPSSTDEVVVARLWEALIGVRPVGVLDDFFELGGDSLLALRFLSQVRKELGAELAIGRMFEAATVREVAAELSRSRRTLGTGQEEVLL